MAESGVGGPVRNCTTQQILTFLQRLSKNGGSCFGRTRSDKSDPLPGISVSYTGSALIVLGVTLPACVTVCELVLSGTLCSFP